LSERNKIEKLLLALIALSYLRSIAETIAIGDIEVIADVSICFALD
jgi:hypothetical protein